MAEISRFSRSMDIMWKTFTSVNKRWSTDCAIEISYFEYQSHRDIDLKRKFCSFLIYYFFVYILLVYQVLRCYEFFSRVWRRACSTDRHIQTAIQTERQNKISSDFFQQILALYSNKQTCITIHFRAILFIPLLNLYADIQSVKVYSYFLLCILYLVY